MASFRDNRVYCVNRSPSEDFPLPAPPPNRKATGLVRFGRAVVKWAVANHFPVCVSVVDSLAVAVTRAEMCASMLACSHVGAIAR